MTTTAPPVVSAPPPKTPAPPRESSSSRARKALSNPYASIAAVTIAVLWTLPTFGLFISSFRPENELTNTGWWTLPWNPGFTLDNYNEVLFSSSSNSGQLAEYFVNSFVIVIPSVLFPLLFATLAAYALAWMDFKGRDLLFVGIFALQIVPLQMALIPLLRFFTNGEVAGLTLFPGGLGLTDEWTAIRVWFAHTVFALPLAIFLLHNFMSELPRSLIEAARVDGASHARIFRSIILPLITPAIAAFGIFQFLWTWNDLLVGLIFSDNSAIAPLTVRVAELAGSRGQDWERLTAGAFVSIIVPMLVFLFLQRYFVRGLLAGGLKG